MKANLKAGVFTLVLCGLLPFGRVSIVATAQADEAFAIEYHDPEVTVYLKPAQSVQIFFPYVVQGVWQKKSPVSIDVQGNYIIATPPKSVSELGPEGSLRAFYLLDKRRYVVRFRWATGISAVPTMVRFVDNASPARASIKSTNGAQRTSNSTK